MQVRSHTRRQFRALLSALPPDIQRRTYQQYARWRHDPKHPSLDFKRVGDGIWSARISDDFRALARQLDIDGHDTFLWFWIGPHKVYDRLI